MKKVALKTRKSSPKVKSLIDSITPEGDDSISQYAFGTGFATDAAALSGQILLNGLGQGLDSIFTNKHPNSDGNMFNLPEEGQIMAFGGPIGGDPVVKVGNIKLPSTSLDFNQIDQTIPSQFNPYIAPGNTTNGQSTYLKPNGGIGMWGNPINSVVTPPNIKPTIDISDKAAGYSNTYYPSNNQMKGKSPAEIESPTGKYAMGGEVKIKPSHRGMFTDWAKKHGMSVSEAASHVVANKAKYSKHVFKMAQFAKNFAALGDSSLQPMTQQQGQNVPVEVEGGEVAQLPNGQTGQFQGPSHEEGGIPANLPQGTKIYSDRLSVDGKSMQARKLSREKAIAKLTNMVDKNPTDAPNRNTYNRMKAKQDMEEQQDLMMQDAAAQIYSKVPQLQDASSGFQTPYENQQEQFGQQQDMGQVQPAGVPRQFATGTGDSGVTDPGGWNDWLINATKPFVPQQPVFDISKATPNIPNIGSPTYNSTDKLDDPNPNFNKPTSTDMPYSTGDKLGFTGNALSSVLPLATTIANRVGDKPNINAFQNFGKNAIDANDKGMGFLSTVRDEALKNAGLAATAQRTRNRNLATSVNTSRALDLATSGQEDASENNIYSSYAQQMAGMYNEKSKLSNQQDLYTDTGAQTAAKEDRMDRDSYYTNLGQNLGNFGHQFQQTGKEINEHDYNNQILSIMPYLNKYGLGFTYDEKGHISGMSKIAS